MNNSNHGMIQIPKGKTVGDMLPQFSSVKNEIGPIGTPCKVCAGCEKSFTAARKPKVSLRLYPTHLDIPVSFIYRLCAQCSRMYRSDGPQRDQVLAAVQNFMLGKE